MLTQIVIAVLSFVAVGLLGWGVTKLRAWNDRRRVYAWLQQNTRDDPYESHVDTLRLTKGVCLPEERVKNACKSDKRIYLSDDGQWSIWSKEPRSVYEKRDLLSVGGD